MKKSKLSIGLVTSFIGALALTACDNSTPAVTKSNTSIVDFIGYNGNSDKIEINIDEMYRELSIDKGSTEQFYRAVLEVLTRFEYPLMSADKVQGGPKSYARLQVEAKDKIKAVQQTARDNAKNNDTSFEKEWDKILDQNDVKNTKALEEKFLYELEKEALSDWYYKAHSESEDINNEHVSGLREQYLGVSENWGEVTGKTENVDSVYPYHILHILVKLSADKDNYIRGTITEDEATKLWQVVRKLIDNKYPWSEVAKLSDDTSKDKYGDVEIMSTATSFYNEFKLGIYAYDALLSGVNEEPNEQNGYKNQSIYNAFGIGKDLNGNDATVTTQTLQSGITKEKVTDLVTKTMVTDVNYHVASATPGTTLPTIPFDVFKQIGEHAKDDKIGTFTPEGSDVSLPRNVLFNAFLNFHSPFVITNELINQSSATETVNDVTTTEYEFDDPSILKLDGHNFKNQLGIGKDVLCDAEGNVVIGVRSEAGIHFMVMRKSVFEETNKKVQKQNTSLLDYYTTAVPGDPEYPSEGQTFVNMAKSDDSSYYTNRANIIKSDIKSTETFDAAYDYRIYETLLDFEYNGSKVKDLLRFYDSVEEYDEQDPSTLVDRTSVINDNINNYISMLRENHHESRYDSLNNAWQTYLLMLINQNKYRSEEGYFKDAFVPTTCAFKFTEGNEDMWKEDGGICYVKN